MRRSEIRVSSDLLALSQVAAVEFVDRAKSAIRSRGRFTVVLSGGSTPKTLYRLLAETPEIKEALEWDKVHFFFSDERDVPSDHPDSNYRMVAEALFSKIAAPASNLHPILTQEGDAAHAAESYERALREFFRLAPGAIPRFDLILLGMGAEGHTASLFPDSEALSESKKLVVAAWVPAVHAWRITLTPPVLNHAEAVVFLVSGAEKAEALKSVIEGDDAPLRFPAQAVKPEQGRLIFLVDAEAARLLSHA